MTLQQQGVGGAPPAAPLSPAGAQAVGVRAEPAVARRPTNVVSRVVFYALLFVATLIFVFPFVWLVSASLKTRQDVFNFDLFTSFHFENYQQIFDLVPMGHWIFNSTLVGLLAASTVT